MITDFHIDENRKREYYEKGYWTEDTINDVWTRQVRQFADREYIRDNYRQYTYGEVDEAAARLARWMLDQGIEPGDVVTVQLPTWAEFPIIFMAVYKIGAVMHPLAKNFNEADLVRAMNLVGSRALVCATFCHKTDYEQQAIDIFDDIPTLDTVLLIDKCAPARSDLPTLSSVLASSEPLREFESHASSDDIACILSTSGSTGVPKSALLTHNSILFSERSMAQGFGLTQDDVAYMPSPLNHAVGFFHGCITPMLLGGRTVLEEQFEADRGVARINATGVTWCMSATPFIYDILKSLEKNKTSLTSMRLFMCGGAPVPPALIELARRHDVLLCEIYGSTESCPHVYVPKEHCTEWNGAW